MSVPLSDGVSLRLHGSVATIIVDQKRRHNAMALKTWLALPALIATAEQHAEVGLIVLRGAHGNFGSGNDLVEFGALHGKPAAAKTFARAMSDAMSAVERASKPVLAAIEGFCYGASVALALACDVRIAASNATFAITPAKLGALYLQSDLHRLVAAVGVSQSKKLIYFARPVGAQEAKDIGLVDEVIGVQDFESALNLLTESILRGSPFTLRQTKKMLRSVEHGATPEETEGSLDVFVAATQGDEFREGVAAFMEKRPPRFR
jgi:enoyl-CoA hydratase/carnithine racemase